MLNLVKRFGKRSYQFNKNCLFSLIAVRRNIQQKTLL